MVCAIDNNTDRKPFPEHLHPETSRPFRIWQYPCLRALVTMLLTCLLDDESNHFFAICMVSWALSCHGLISPAHLATESHIQKRNCVKSDTVI